MREGDRDGERENDRGKMEGRAKLMLYCCFFYLSLSYFLQATRCSQTPRQRERERERERWWWV